MRIVQQPWISPDRKQVLCVDSYRNAVLDGRLYSPSLEMERFTSLSQFLIRMEDILDETQMPQSYTTARRFSSLLLQEDNRCSSRSFRKGAAATFDLQILFRQHSSWQGILTWRERGVEHSFRSVLELVILLDSALRSMEEAG